MCYASVEMIWLSACQFDLPSYHYWLNLDQKQRDSDFYSWLTCLLPVYEGIKNSCDEYLIRLNSQQMLQFVVAAQYLY